MAQSIFAKSKPPFLQIVVLVILAVGIAFAVRQLFFAGPADITAPAGASLEDPRPSAPVVPASQPAPTPASPVEVEPAAQPVAPEPVAPPVVETTPPPVAATVDPYAAALELFESGREAHQQDRMIQGRKLLSDAVLTGLPAAQDKTARQLLSQAADKWLFSKGIYEGDVYCQRYRVQSGDVLANIGKKFDIPYEFLMRINSISDPRRLAAGQTLKIAKGAFHLIVNRKTFQMSVFLGDVLVRTYPVGLGAPGRDTPTGMWRAKQGAKVVNPPWTDPDSPTGRTYMPNDPENPLGERWIGLEGIQGEAKGRPGFGIHGTIKPEEIGRAVSRGCIRLYNEDVEELYDMVTAGKTLVKVVDE